jgi:hypothetical protein
MNCMPRRREHCAMSGWDILWFSGFRGLLNPLSADGLAQFRQAHRAEIECFASDQGIWLNVEVLVSGGRKPQAASPT